MIEDGWPLSKIAEDFSVASHEDIMKLIPRESFENDAMGVVEDIKYNMLDYEPSAPHPQFAVLAHQRLPIRNQETFREGAERATKREPIFQRFSGVSVAILGILYGKILQPYNWQPG